MSDYFCLYQLHTENIENLALIFWTGLPVAAFQGKLYINVLRLVLSENYVE
jgi:hypothetical protein